MAKKSHLKSPQVPNLEPLLYGEWLSASEWRNWNYIYVLDTKLELHDYDWSKYAFSGME